MRDLAKRLDDMAAFIKHGDHSDREVMEERLDSIRSLLREASCRIGIMEMLLMPRSFSYSRDGDTAMVTLRAELDSSQVGELLELISEHAP